MISFDVWRLLNSIETWLHVVWLWLMAIYYIYQTGKTKYPYCSAEWYDGCCNQTMEQRNKTIQSLV